MFRNQKKRERAENKSKPVENTKTNQGVKHFVLFVESFTQKVILGKHGCSVCIASYGHIRAVSPNIQNTGVPEL